MSDQIRYVVMAKADGRDWREWENHDSYEEGRKIVAGLRTSYPRAKFRLVERTVHDVITEA